MRELFIEMFSECYGLMVDAKNAVNSVNKAAAYGMPKYYGYDTQGFYSTAIKCILLYGYKEAPNISR